MKEDFRRWCDAIHDANLNALVNALRLHKDPNRGRTHIVLRKLSYTPDASHDLRRKFHMDGAIVCRIKDSYGFIEKIMGLDPGEGKEYVDSVVDPIPKYLIPLVTLTWCEGSLGDEAWLNTGTRLASIKVSLCQPL